MSHRRNCLLRLIRLVSHLVGLKGVLGILVGVYVSVGVLYTRALTWATAFIHRRGAILSHIDTKLLISILLLLVVFILFIVILFVVLFSDMLRGDHAHLEKAHAHEHAAVLLILSRGSDTHGGLLVRIVPPMTVIHVPVLPFSAHPEHRPVVVPKPPLLPPLHLPFLILTLSILLIILIIEVSVVDSLVLNTNQPAGIDAPFYPAI